MDENRFHLNTSIETATIENQFGNFNVSPHDFVWITTDEQCKTALPLKVQVLQKKDSAWFIGTDQGWIKSKQIQNVMSEDRWIRLTANEWLMNAVFSKSIREEKRDQTLIAAKELKILTGYQQSMVRWYLLQHKEVQDVWFEKQDQELLLGVKFCFLKRCVLDKC